MKYTCVTDFDGQLYCVIKTLEREDENLESLKEGHIDYLKREGKEIGYTFSEEMPIFFEKFEVVHL